MSESCDPDDLCRRTTKFCVSSDGDEFAGGDYYLVLLYDYGLRKLSSVID